MSIPFTYAIGLAAVLLSRELFFVVPGTGRWPLALVGMTLLALPLLLERASQLRLQRRGFDRLGRALARLSALALPSCYLVVLGPCGYLDLVDREAGDSFVLEALMLLTPLFAAEVARIVAGSSRANADAGEAMAQRSRLAFVCVFTLPWLGLAICGDVLRAHRATYALVVGSGAGLTLGATAFVLGMGILLPLVFRVLFGLRRDLPEAIADELRRTAAALGFPGRAVLWLDSGMRHVNALLIGPLPWPRYLVLTDGLMAVLDVQALRGVVAHEVGHAQAGHPMLLLGLFVVTPLLGAGALQEFEPEHLDTWLAAAGVAVALLVGWRVLRRVAHRFEHEADVLSAIALGGAEPCIGALQRVGQVVQQDAERASLLHPSERDRVDVLRRFAGDAEYRARFTLRGLWLRRAIAGLLFVAALGAAIVWYRSWPYEQAALRFYVGDFAGARARMEAVGGDVPGRLWQWWQTLHEDLDAAIAIAGDGGDWEALRPRLASEGWRRGIEALRTGDATVARPWFALAVEDAEQSPLRRCVLLYCEAVRDGDLARQSILREHLLGLDLPADLRTALGRR